ncbi:MAG: DUF159 family protein [Alphaproteobacteria bacterium]|nr:MAG: DUF159 family protein [Alphaproteobacteria bacterium]
MSRLHAVATSAEELAAHFAIDDAVGVVVPSETVEGSPGLVVLENNGRRLLKSLAWGFPRVTRDMRLRGETPSRIGLVADLTSPMWEHIVVEPRYRCLIPLTHFANPEGDPGQKTRSWFSVKDRPIIAWAGFCQNTPEFGPVYAGMTMTANEAVMPWNDRMPVLLEPHEWDRWLHGSIQDVIGFQFRDPFASDRMLIEHTDDAWRSGELPPSAKPQLALI